MWLDRQSEEIFATALKWQVAGDPVALALVIGVEGSGYRKPGARLLVGRDGHFIGLVSGGCLEQDVVEATTRVQQTGEARVLEFDTRPEEDVLWGWGSGCRGLVHVLLHRPERDVLQALHDELESGRTALLATVVSGGDGFPPLGAQMVVLEDGTVVGDAALQPYLRLFADSWPNKREMVAVDNPEAMRIVDGFAHGGSQAELGAVLVEPMRPAPRLLIVGAGDDVPAVVDVATTAGLRTTVVDHRPGFADEARFPKADRVLVSSPETVTDDVLRAHRAVVVMTHQFEWDRRWLARLSSVPFAYFGVLGPPDRTRRLLSPSEDGGSPEAADASQRVRDLLPGQPLYGPVGLDIGGEGPGPIAVSLVAELLAVLHGRSGGHLQDNYERNKRKEREATASASTSALADGVAAGRTDTSQSA